MPLFPATPPVPLRTLIVVEVCEEVSWWQVEVETHKHLDPRVACHLCQRAAMSGRVENYVGIPVLQYLW